ncbi:unnamed protein product [Arabidopsis halleri]
MESGRSSYAFVSVLVLVVLLFSGEANAICKFGIGKCTYPGKCQQDCIDKGFYFGGDCETTKKGSNLLLH